MGMGYYRLIPIDGVTGFEKMSTIHGKIRDLKISAEIQLVKVAEVCPAGRRHGWINQHQSQNDPFIHPFSIKQDT
jgi:hypothetical protein